MKRAARQWWFGLSLVSSSVALACTGNNATVGAMNDAGAAGAAGTSGAGSAGAAGSSGTAGSAGVAGSIGIAGSAGTAGSTGEAPCAPNDFASDGCNSCSCTDAKTWACTNSGCDQLGCPAAQTSAGANCSSTPIFAKDPTTGTCCPYASACAAPSGWADFASASACMGIDSGGCPAGFSDCNQSKQDGCETRTPAGTTCANACAASPNTPDGGSVNACPSEACPAGSVCVVEVGGVAGGGGAHCAPIPSNCDGQPSCACMKYCGCANGFGSRPETCREQAGVIYCDNGVR